MKNKNTPLKLTCLLLALWAISAVFLLPVAHVYADPTSNAAAASNLTGSSSSSLSGITTTTAPTTSNNSTTVGSTPTEYGYICTPDNTTQGSAFNVQRCVNNIYIFSIAVASFVAIIMFVFAGYLYISGDSNRISEAKDIMQSTITALVLLFSVYLILNFIDPSFNNIPGAILPAIHCGATQSAQSANNTASGYVNCLPPPPAAVNGVTGAPLAGSATTGSQGSGGTNSTGTNGSASDYYVLDGYNIGPYATNPSHEAICTQIFNGSRMNAVNVTDPASINQYIQGTAANSPITGDMVLSAANSTGVDPKMILTMMQADSSMGTAGLGSRTYNPGNVGNDDTGKQVNYNNWQTGVNAVANWLAKHEV